MYMEKHLLDYLEITEESLYHNDAPYTEEIISEKEEFHDYMNDLSEQENSTPVFQLFHETNSLIISPLIIRMHEPILPNNITFEIHEK